MYGLVAAVQWDGARDLRSIVEPAITDMRAFDRLRQALLVEEPTICIGAVFRSAPAEVHRTADTIAVLDGDVYPEAGRRFHDLGEVVDALAVDVVDGLYNLLSWDVRLEELTVRTDLIGAKPLYYWVGEGFAVLSTELKTFRLVPGLSPRLNLRAWAATLVLGHPVDDATLIEEVKALPIANGIRLSSSGMTPVSQPMLLHTRDRYGESEPDLVRDFDETLRAGAEQWLRDTPAPLISLSGGLDSRGALGYAMKVAPEMVAATFGEPGSEDFEVAARAAQQVGVRHLRCEVTGDRTYTRTELGQAAWSLESFGAVYVPFYGVPWFDFLEDQARPVINGFVGDIKPDKNFGIAEIDFECEPDDVRDDLWRAKSTSRDVRVLSAHASADFASLLSRDVAEGLRVQFDSLPGDQAFQRLMLLDLYLPSRRYLATSGPHLCDAASGVRLPFYTRAVMEFYAGIPLPQLSDRALYRKTLLARFPDLARVKEADKWSVSKGFIGKKIDRVRYSHKVRRVLRIGSRPHSYSVFSTLVDRHIDLMTETIAGTQELVGDMLDVRALAADLRSDRSQISKELLMRLYNTSVFLRGFFDVPGDQVVN